MQLTSLMLRYKEQIEIRADEISTNGTFTQSQDEDVFSLLFRAVIADGIPEPDKLDIINQLISEGESIPTEDFAEYFPEEIKLRQSQTDSNKVVVYIELKNRNNDTIIVDILRRTKSNFFEKACACEARKLIDKLINEKFVEKRKKSLQFNFNSNKFKNGFWISVIESDGIRNEIKILGDRHAGKATELTSATFIHPKYRPNLFSPSTHKTGVFISKNKKTIPYWYSGVLGKGEEVTDDRKFLKKIVKKIQESGNKTIDNHHFINLSHEEVFAAYPECLRLSNRFDSNLILANRSSHIPWNEGMFEYEIEDIMGIYVNPHDKDSIGAAIKLRNAICDAFSFSAAQLPFLNYDRENFQVFQLPSMELLTKLGEKNYAPGASQRRNSIADFS